MPRTHRKDAGCDGKASKNVSDGSPPALRDGPNMPWGTESAARSSIMPADLILSLSNHEVVVLPARAPSWFDKLSMRAFGLDENKNGAPWDAVSNSPNRRPQTYLTSRIS
jgi:hypothetical protein